MTLRMNLRPVVAVLAVALAVGGLARVAHTEILTDSPSRASDALPLYLSGAAVDAGLDPTQERSLAQVYDQRALSVGAATFSTLYPATAGVLLQPFASLSWPDFTRAWRWSLWLSIALFGVAGGVAARGDRWTNLAWGGALTALLAWHPITAECVRLGQVNMGLGAVCAAAMTVVTRSRSSWLADLLCGALLGLGGAVKLVPAALLLPLLAARRWRTAVGAALVGGVTLAAALPIVPLGRMVEAIQETLRFQAAIDPDWLVGQSPAPGWMRVLGFIRHDALPWITLGACGLIPALRPSARTAVAGMGLLCAWLGADAAGFHVLYAPLAWPVFVLFVGRPWVFIPLVLVFYGFVHLPGLTPEPRMVLFGLVAWVLAAGELVRAAGEVQPGPAEADPELRQAGLALAGVVSGALLVGAVPGDGPVAAPLPEGQSTPAGPGFIHAGYRVPGAVRALGGGLDRPASTLARPGTIRGLQLYMRSAPGAWRALAERYPARAAVLSGRADGVPGGDLRDHSGREMAVWLGSEAAAVVQLTQEGLDVGELSRALDVALTSGLTDADLGARIEGE